MSSVDLDILSFVLKSILRSQYAYAQLPMMKKSTNQPVMLI